MARTIYINTDKGSIESAPVAGINRPSARVPLREIVAGTTETYNLYLVKSDGTYDSRSGSGAVSVNVAIGQRAQTATSGNFTVTDSSGTSAEISATASAQAVEDVLNAMNSGTGAEGGLCDVQKLGSGIWLATWRENGARTVLTGASVDLTPESVVVPSISVTGDASSKCQQLIEVNRQPAIFQDTWSTITNGFSGTLDADVGRIVQAMSDGQSIEFYFEVRIDDDAICSTPIRVLAPVGGAASVSSAAPYGGTLASDPANYPGFSVSAWESALSIEGFSAIAPNDEAVIRGNGTEWVSASNFRVDAGTLNTGTEMGTGTANGDYAVAEGAFTTASGEASHAEGDSTTASGAVSHAEGELTTASGAVSHAEGSSTTASGTASHAEGDSTTASGDYSHAEGTGTTASGDYSHAEGASTTASGDYSSATGRRAKAIHDGARVEADSQNADVSSTTTDQFTARFQNGYEFKGGLAAFEGGASFGDAATQAITRANLGVALDASGGNVVYVNDNTDFPAAVAGVITLEAGKTYIINTDIDLLGDRIECPASSVTILGRSSETSSLTSTTLGASSPLITATRTLALQDFTVKDVGTAFDIDGLGGTNVALDWRGFNVSNVPTIGTIQNIDNHIWQICAILDSGGLTYTNGVNTIAFSDSIISARSGTTAVTLDSNILLGRRFRVIYSAVIAGAPSSTAFDVDALAAVPIEGYILDTVNFAGGGTYQAGKSVTDNEALFVNCVGIPNSREISNYYMNGNATATTITTQNVEVKVAGATTSNTLTQKFTNTDNRATYVGAISRFFKAVATISVESGNNQQIGVYLAKNGTIIPSTEVYGTTSGNGRAENIVVQGLFELQSNDYVEVFIENSTATTDITVTDLNLIIE